MTFLKCQEMGAIEGVSDQDAPYLRIRVRCITLKITKLEAAAGQACKHCLTMFEMERMEATCLHTPVLHSVVSIPAIIKHRVHVCRWLITGECARWQQVVSVVTDSKYNC